MPEYTNPPSCRPFDFQKDLESVLDLINGSPVPGQPVCTKAMLMDCLKGVCLVDEYYWNDLSPPQIRILSDEGVIFGVYCYADMKKEESVYLLWLFGKESKENIKTLLDDLHAYAGGREIQAFQIASAINLGLEALPVDHRGVTHECLVKSGYQAEDAWAYMMRGLHPGECFRYSFDSSVTVKKTGNEKYEKFSFLRQQEEIGHIILGVYQERTGVIWYFEVEEPFRGQGVGANILKLALDYFCSRRASRVIMYVDDQDNDRKAAAELYGREKFFNVSRLYSYVREKTGLQ